MPSPSGPAAVKTCRRSSNLSAQPALDDGHILPLDAAEEIFARIRSYPNYQLYVAELGENQIIGSFAMPRRTK